MGVKAVCRTLMKLSPGEIKEGKKKQKKGQKVYRKDRARKSKKMQERTKHKERQRQRNSDRNIQIERDIKKERKRGWRERERENVIVSSSFNKSLILKMSVNLFLQTPYGVDESKVCFSFRKNRRWD